MVGEAHLKEECLRQVWSSVERLVSCVSYQSLIARMVDKKSQKAKRTVPLILSHLQK